MATHWTRLNNVRIRLLAGCLVVFGLFLGPGCKRTSDTVDTDYKYAPSKEAEGTGKFYLGREIARVTEGAEWPGRDDAEFPDRVIEVLNLKPTDFVADIGAGTGYFTVRLAPRVPQGKVFAVDIQQEMLDHIAARVQEEGFTNVELVQGTEQDPRLPEGMIDMVLIVGSYHEFSHPKEMLQQSVRALKPGGKLVLVEYRGEDPTLPIDPLHRMTEEQARKEMEASGLRWQETEDVLPQQHLMVFRKPVQ